MSSHLYHCLFAFTADDHWEPGIGDPTVVGWVTVVAYFVAALACGLCMRRYRRLPAKEGGVGWVFWGVFFVTLVLLGINKQLDLQTWFTLFAKQLALSEGWYEERRPVQAVFIGAVALGGAASLVGLRMLVSQATRPMRLALVGGVFLACFVVIRAASFHHVDQMLGFDFEGIKMNWVLELGGISVIACAAFAELRTRRLQADRLACGVIRQNETPGEKRLAHRDE